jgi:hypothetical protein
LSQSRSAALQRIRRKQSSSLCIARRWPIVFCYTTPEAPDGHDGEQGEEHFEHATIDLVVCAVADVNGDDELEDLAEGKEDGGGGEVDWREELVVW